MQSEGAATQLSSPLACPLPSKGQSESCLQNPSQTAHRLEGDLGKKGGPDHGGDVEDWCFQALRQPDVPAYCW